MLVPGVARGKSLALVGNSHILTMFEGYQLKRAQLPERLEITFIAKGQHRIGYAVGSPAGIERRQPSEGLLDLVEALAASQIFVMWLGSQVNIRGLLLRGPAFDVLLPTEGDRPIDAAVELIPCSAVEFLVRRTLDADRELSELIDRAQHRGAKVWLMAPPHVLPDQAIRQRLENESHFAARLRQFGLSAEDANIVPELVRVRLRRLLLAAYRGYASEHGAGFSPPPDRVADEAGMLLPQYWGNDITHGSAAYGAAYLQELVAVAGGYRA
jgi:hypothetical protein